HGKVIFYADRVTGSMQRALDETTRRREIQLQFNVRNGITPTSILKPIDRNILAMTDLDYYDVPMVAEDEIEYGSMEEVEQEIERLRLKMKEAAEKFEFEKAAEFRDRIKQLQGLEMDFGGNLDADQAGR
ncbi:MAG: UvrB/UvrC motif-containing protein, partial [Acidobacteriota bacterium]